MSVIAPIRVKISCIESPDEARMAVSYGAAVIGVISEVPSDPGRIDLDTIAEIVRAVPDDVGTFLITSETEVDRLVETQQRTAVNTLQLWDRLSPGDYELLRRKLPSVALVHSLHVQDESAVSEALDLAPHVDALVLDSGNPAVPYRWELPTGRVHDWSISRRIVEVLDRPVFLAGGLTPGNVGDAIARVRPYGVAVCTGVRTDDRLDRGKLTAFFESVGRVAPRGIG